MTIAYRFQRTTRDLHFKITLITPDKILQEKVQQEVLSNRDFKKQ